MLQTLTDFLESVCERHAFTEPYVLVFLITCHQQH